MDEDPFGFGGLIPNVNGNSCNGLRRPGNLFYPGLGRYDSTQWAPCNVSRQTSAPASSAPAVLDDRRLLIVLGHVGTGTYVITSVGSLLQPRKYPVNHYLVQQNLGTSSAGPSVTARLGLRIPPHFACTTKNLYGSWRDTDLRLVARWARFYWIYTDVIGPNVYKAGSGSHP